MDYLCFRSNKTTGYQLEKLFEPHLIKIEDGVTKRSCKWDRYLKGTTPRKEFLALIKRKYPEVIKLYNSSLWRALRTGQQGEEYWIKLYQSLSPEIRNLGFQYRSLENVSFMSIGKRKHEVLDKLFRIGNTESLTCLISLLRESNENKEWTSYDYIETRIFNLIYWIIGGTRFFGSRQQLLSYLKQYVFTMDLHDNPLLRESPWNLSSQQVDERININYKNICLAEDLELISTKEDLREFVYWKMKGNNFLIVREMVDILYSKKSKLAESNEQGLKWLVEKLNKSRSKSQKIVNRFIQ